MKKFYKKLLILILVLPLIPNCSSRVASFLPNRPDTEMDDSLTNVSVEFKQGWQDGCESGMAAGSNTFYKIFYRNNKVDGYKMVGSSDYKTAWSNSFWYCYRYDYIKQKSSIWGSVFSGVI